MSRSKNCCCVPMDNMCGSQLCCMPTQGQQMYQVSPVQIMPANYNPGYPGYENNNNGLLWILILLLGTNGIGGNNGFDGGCGCNNGCNNGCHSNNNSWLWIIILLCCCGGGNSGFGGCGFGC